MAGFALATHTPTVPKTLTLASRLPRALSRTHPVFIGSRVNRKRKLTTVRSKPFHPPPSSLSVCLFLPLSLPLSLRRLGHRRIGDCSPPMDALSNGEPLGGRGEGGETRAWLQRRSSAESSIARCSRSLPIDFPLVLRFARSPALPGRGQRCLTTTAFLRNVLLAGHDAINARTKSRRGKS